MATGGHEIAGPGLPELVGLVNLLVVIAIIYVFGKKGIVAAVSQRSTDISKNLKSAKSELVAVEARLQKAKLEFNNLTTKQREVLDSVRTEGERLSQQILEETNKAVAQILSDAELSAKSEVRQAAQKIRSSLVQETFAQTLGQLEGTTAKARDQKTGIHEKLFEKLVGEVPSHFKASGGSR